MNNKKIEQKSLLKYKKEYEKNKNFKEWFSLKDYKNQYNMVKAFYKVFEKDSYWNTEEECIMKAMSEFKIVKNLKILERDIGLKEFKVLEEIDKPFYGGKVKKRNYIYHEKTKTTLVIGSKNLENFIECDRKICGKCDKIYLNYKEHVKVDYDGNVQSLSSVCTRICKDCKEKKEKVEKIKKERDKKKKQREKKLMLALRYTNKVEEVCMFDDESMLNQQYKKKCHSYNCNIIIPSKYIYCCRCYNL